MKTGIKSIELSDFEEIRFEQGQLGFILREFRKFVPEARIDATDTIGHPMRTWEWGRVLLNIKEMFGYPFSQDPRVSVLDIGTAVSLIGPALAYLGCNVQENDVDGGWKRERLALNRLLEKVPSAGEFRWTQAGFGTLRERCSNPWGVTTGQYDVVMSISTIEHVETSLELGAWREMFDLLKPGGLMIVTMDCFPEAKKGYIYDAVRYTNYDMKLVKKRVDELKSYGMIPVGEEDYRWHGVHVDDGSFASVHMRKPF